MKKRIKPFLALLFFLFCWGHVYSQTTEFTYQGNLTVEGTPANGSFDFTFLPFDVPTGGIQIAGGNLLKGVMVTNGVFSVRINFGHVFPGQDRFLEIKVRPSGAPTFTTLSPRQLITSSPYAVKSRSADNAVNLNNEPANFYTNASNLASGTVPAARLGNGPILNQTTQQASSNFNISGNGTVGGAFSVGGNAGFGTSTPNARLTVVDSSTTQIRFGTATNDGGGYLISNLGSEATISGGARFDGTNWLARNSQTSRVENRAGVISFFANSGLTPNTTFTPSERMRITDTGRVGIGTVSPSARLTVTGVGAFFDANPSRFDLINQATGSTSYSLFVNNSGLFQVATTAGQSRFLIDSAGNVGLGVTDPQQRLDVSGNARVSGELHRPATGNSNLVPIAYGYVRGDGTVEGGTGNFTATRTETGEYAINIAGENFFPGNHIATVTLAPGGSGTVAFMATTGITGEQPNLNLAVWVHNTLSARVNCAFYFVVYKP